MTATPYRRAPSQASVECASRSRRAGASHSKRLPPRLAQRPLVADASNAAAVGALFDAAVLALGGAPDVVVYNASQRVRGPFVEVDAEAVARAVDVTAIGAFRVAQQAVTRMLPERHGAGPAPHGHVQQGVALTQHPSQGRDANRAW